MKRRYIIYLIVGIVILVVPTTVYLCFLLPKMREEYIVLMASGGVVGGSGIYGVHAIPDKIKYSGLFKFSAKAFTLLTISALIEQFYDQIIWLIVVAVISFIIFRILLGVYRDRRQIYRENRLAQEVARNIDKTIK